MPYTFGQHLVQVVAIVDCYEIKIEKPSHLVAKEATTWSQDKYSNTVKEFVAIGPQVTLFIFLAWGGRVSDTLLMPCTK